jgi:hypothetical protein
LRIVSDAPSSPDSISLTGRGVQPAFTASPTSVEFPAQTVGTSSVEQTVTVTNSGAGELQFPAGAVTLTGADSASFVISADTCSAVVVAQAATCAVQVRFTPSAAGQTTAVMRWVSNAPGSPHQVSLSGIGATAPPTGKKKQTLKAKPPKRIKRAGTTLITPAKARTNAGQRVRTIVRGGPIQASAAGQVRYFKVIRGKKGKVAIRTYGYRALKIRVVQRAPSTPDYRKFKRVTVYKYGKRV